MPVAGATGKLYRLFTHLWEGAAGRQIVAGLLAIALFVLMFAFGQTYFGWSDTTGKVQMVMFISFILGCVAGFKSRG